VTSIAALRGPLDDTSWPSHARSSSTVSITPTVSFPLTSAATITFATTITTTTTVTIPIALASC
jgi:hypothetical protein